MAGLNKSLIIGNVGQSPDIRIMQNGDRVASLSVATSESWKDKSGERKEKTQWHKIVVFNQNIVNVIEKYVHKGSKIYIEGQLETRSWEKDGVKQYTTEIVVKPFRGELLLLDSKGEGRMETETSKDLHNAAGSVPEEFEDSIPFDRIRTLA